MTVKLVNGVREGKAVIVNGSVPYMRLEYKRGSLTGIVERMNEYGSVELRGHLVNGIEDGLFEEFDDNMVVWRGYYRNGRRKDMDEDGSMRRSGGLSSESVSSIAVVPSSQIEKLKGDMQWLLNLNDYGYESDYAGEIIRDCKKKQRDYNTSKCSGIDAMRFYKRLLGRYKDALIMEVNRLCSLISVQREEYKRVEEEEMRQVASAMWSGISINPLDIAGAFAIGVASECQAKMAKNAINNRADRYENERDKENSIIRKIEQIEENYSLSTFLSVC